METCLLPRGSCHWERDSPQKGIKGLLLCALETECIKMLQMFYQLTWLSKAMALILKWIASVWIWSSGVSSRTVGVRACLHIFPWLKHDCCYGKRVCLALFHHLFKGLAYAVEIWGTWQKQHFFFLSFTRWCVVKPSILLEEKGEKWHSTEGNKNVAPLVNVSLSQGSQVFVYSSGFPGRGLLTADLREKPQRTKWERTGNL